MVWKLSRWFDSLDGLKSFQLVWLFRSLAFRHAKELYETYSRDYLALFEFLFDEDDISCEPKPIEIFKGLELWVLCTQHINILLCLQSLVLDKEREESVSWLLLFLRLGKSL